MESTFSTTSSRTISAVSKTLNHSNSAALISHLHRHYSFIRPTQSIIRSQLAFLRLRHSLRTTAGASKFNSFPPSSSLRGLTAASVLVPPGICRLRCFSASFASAGGGGGGIGGGDGGGSGGGGGDGPADGREVRSNAVPGGTDDVSALSSDVIILDVGGMSCGGCAASVKRILESQPQVSSASVNLTTETAIVWPILEAKVEPNWQKNLGDELAKHLTTCGFKSNPRGEAETEGEILS